MKNKKLNETESIETGRRKLLTRLGKGGAVLGAACALPETWVKPLITSTVLPAHAQTSTIVMNYTFESCSFDFNGMTQDSTGPVTDITVMAMGMVSVDNYVATISSPASLPLNMINITALTTGDTMDMAMDMTNMMGVANDFQVDETVMSGQMFNIEFSFTDTNDSTDTCEFNVTVT